MQKDSFVQTRNCQQSKADEKWREERTASPMRSVWQRVQASEKPFPCQACGAAFTTQASTFQLSRIGSVGYVVSCSTCIAFDNCEAARRPFNKKYRKEALPVRTIRDWRMWFNQTLSVLPMKHSGGARSHFQVKCVEQHSQRKRVLSSFRELVMLVMLCHVLHVLHSIIAKPHEEPSIKNIEKKHYL